MSGDTFTLSELRSDLAKDDTFTLNDISTGPLPIHPSLASAANIANTMMFGFGDEVYGMLAPGDYKKNRDDMRATIESFRKENPASAMIGDIGGSLIFGSSIPRLTAMAAPVTAMGKAGIAAVTGGIQGGLSGAGNAQELENVPGGVLKGSAIGAGIGGASSLGGSAMSGAWNAVAPRFSSLSAEDVAKRRIAEMIARDTKGTVPLTIPMMQARAKTLGHEATVADAAGKNTRQLLDTVATLPGRTANNVETLIHQRQAGRAGRLIDAADDAMGTMGVRMNDAKASFIQKAEDAAKPLYAKVQNKIFTVDQNLQSILQRGQSALGEAKKLAQVEGTLNTFPSGDPSTWKAVDFNTLNTMKKTLYDMAEGTRSVETGKLSGLGLAYNKLRHDLTGYMDDATNGVYKAARDAFAGPMEMQTANALGFKAMSQDAWKIADITKGMSASEREAFNIGAMEALRKKLGTESGQTSIIKMWKEPATRDKLKELFPTENAFRKFAASAAAEGRLKALESVGRGSQTASRLAGQDELLGSTMKDTLNLAASMKSQNPIGIWQSAKDLYGRATTPEPVRDAIGKLLMTKPTGSGWNDLQSIQAIMDMNARRAAQQSATAGSFGLLGGMF